MENDLIRLEKVTKRFGGVTALNSVSFSIGKGEVHAVVGENGAGKSTLMKILAGNYIPDSGTISLRGNEVKINDPLEARRLGVSIVYQELNLFPDLTATGNIFLNREPLRLGLMDEREMEAETRRVFEQMGVNTIDPCAKVVSSLWVSASGRDRRTIQQHLKSLLWMSRTPLLRCTRPSGCSKLSGGCEQG
jgi:ABC-type sugar transport system ATPase subunit